MKTKYWVVTTLAIFIVAISFATETPKMDVRITEAEKALVVFNSETALPVEITISSENGEILYFAKNEKPETEYKKLFDLAELGDGCFTICMNYGGNSVSRDLFISRNQTKVGPVKKLYEPCFCFKKERLNVSHFNVAQKNVYLNIYENGVHVTGVNLGKTLSIQKCLDFSKLKKGEYEIVLTDDFKDHHFIVQK